jgi:hypothetical protein
VIYLGNAKKKKKKKRVGMSEREKSCEEKKKSLKDHTFFVVFNSFISLLINSMIFAAFYFWCYMSISL